MSNTTEFKSLLAKSKLTSKEIIEVLAESNGLNLD